MITLLTPEGTVTVKYDSGQFNHYDKQISYMNELGKKVTLEDGWFRRGNKILLVGYKKDGKWKPKKYRDTVWQHTTMLIEGVDKENNLIIKTERSRV